MTAAAAAARTLDTTQAQIGNIEANRFGVSAERVRTLAQIYACPDTALIDALESMAGDRTRSWWEEYRDTLPSGLLDLAELEHHAIRLRTAYTAHIPGLLQTTGHAREVFQSAVPPLPPPDVEHRLSHRIKRQAVLGSHQALRERRPVSQPSTSPPPTLLGASYRAASRNRPFTTNNVGH